jgi:hypothetical protein
VATNPVPPTFNESPIGEALTPSPIIRNRPFESVANSEAVAVLTALLLVISWLVPELEEETESVLPVGRSADTSDLNNAVVAPVAIKTCRAVNPVTV